MKISELILILLLVLKPTDLQKLNLADEWVAWNVGQGQWITHVYNDTCLHYDIGGEKQIARKIRHALQTYCFHRLNRIYLSHWDLDHYSMIPSFLKWTPKICWADHPKWNLEKKSVIQIQELNIPWCLDASTSKTWRPSAYVTTNESSLVVIDRKVLTPGDSPTNIEKQWIHFLKDDLVKTKVLILGHHGSRTSTSNLLLSKLKGLKYAIASARYAKYHHPHTQTMSRLQKNKVPVLKTEDWGHIHWQN